MGQIVKDLVYQLAVVELDLGVESVNIFDGMVGEPIASRNLD